MNELIHSFRVTADLEPLPATLDTKREKAPGMGHQSIAHTIMHAHTTHIIKHK